MVYKHQGITEKIIGAAFEAHKFLGSGYREVVYQRALAWELEQKGLTFGREVERNIFYKELKTPIGKRRADFIVEDKVVIELKSRKELEDHHIAQTLSYLKVYKLQVALLINFGAPSLQFKRLVLTL